MSSSYDSVPKISAWIYFHNLLNTFLNLDSEIYINNNFVTNSRVPVLIDGRNVYKNMCIGYFLEYTSELGYIIKKLSNNFDLKNHIYLKYYKNGTYNIENITFVEGF